MVSFILLLSIDDCALAFMVVCRELWINSAIVYSVSVKVYFFVVHVISMLRSTLEDLVFRP